jgi:DNA repair exonuclease SbcCD ATPase subunit
MKSFLPWLVALALLAAAAFLHSSNRKLSEQVASLRAEIAEVEALRAEVEELKTSGSPAQAQEIARLRQNTEELMKARGENQRLRGEVKDLTQRTQAAQAQVQAAQAREQAANEQAQAYAKAAVAARQPAALTPGGGVAPGRVLVQAPTPEQAVATCINNLRQLDGAKQQWALENRKEAKAVPQALEVATYLRGGFPACPGGGTYTLGPVEAVPTCSVPGHALPE